MKILFVHLSDSHIKDDRYLTNQKIDGFIASLRVYDSFDECIIVYSGDISQSGKESEFRFAETLIGKMISRIRRSFFPGGKLIYTLFVPGNHDMNNNNEPRCRIEILKGSESKSANTQSPSDDSEKLGAFFSFAQRNKCFINSTEVDVRFINLNNYIIQVNLINTAYNSTFLDPNGDNDKGIHQLSKQSIEQMYRGRDSNLCISIMHHGPEWFDGIGEKNIVDALFENTDILFEGHEHNPKNTDSKKGSSRGYKILSGGAFDENHEFGYNLSLLDTVNRKIESYSFQWNLSTLSFINKGKEFSRLPGRIRNKSGFPLNDDFLRAFVLGGHTNLSKNFTDYFVFPRLIVKSDKEYNGTDEVNDLSEFNDILSCHKIVIIEGNDLSGKSCLLKYVYLKLQIEAVPLFFDADNLGGKKIERVIKNAFEDQYSDEGELYQQFQQLPIQKRIAVIDNAEKIDPKQFRAVMEIFCTKFSLVILSKPTEWEFDISKVITSSNSNDSNESIRLRIRPYYEDKRIELIKNVCKCRSDLVFASDLETTAKKIDVFIKNQLQIFNLYPNFIIMFSEYFIANSSDKGNANIFSSVFQTNIVIALQMANIKNVDTVLFLLQLVAFYIHSQKRYPLSFLDFSKIINNYNSDYEQKIDVLEIYNSLLESRILKKLDVEGNVKFTTNNILAYFVAKEINRLYNAGTGTEEVRRLSENICFGINGDIILFLSFLTENTNILNFIRETSEKYMESWTLYDIESGNLEFLSKAKNGDELTAPSKKDVDEKDKRTIDREKDLINEETINTVDIYDYDETESETYIMRCIKSIKFIEIVAKILPNFYHRIPKSDKTLFVQAIYNQPNKLIYFLMQQYDTHFDEIIDRIMKILNSLSDTKKYSRAQVVDLFVDYSICCILGIYDYSARIVADSNTIDCLDRFDYKDKYSYSIQNLMMHENMRDTESFGKRAEMLFDKSASVVVKSMIRRIVRKHIIYENVKAVGYGQHLVTKFFPGNTKSIISSRSKMHNEVVHK